MGNILLGLNSSVYRSVRGDNLEAVYMVRGSVLFLSFIEPNTRDRPTKFDRPVPHDAPRNVG